MKIYFSALDQNWKLSNLKWNMKPSNHVKTSDADTTDI